MFLKLNMSCYVFRMLNFNVPSTFLRCLHKQANALWTLVICTYVRHILTCWQSYAGKIGVPRNSALVTTDNLELVFVVYIKKEYKDSFVLNFIQI